ncbi:MAG: hypothetical protein EP332_00575 [Bacteroidetes bacterium]|nr:MAG: hypothetical protein EP332_00575 [Bacteroidota bacterium]
MRKPFYRFLKLGLVLFIPLFSSAQDAIEAEDEDYDHSSYVGFNLGMLNLLKQSTSPVFNPNIKGAYVVGVHGAWLPHRNLGLDGSVSFGSASPANFDWTQGRWTIPPSVGHLNRGMLQGGLLLSYPFDYFCIELTGGVGYSYWNGLNKRVFSLDGEPDYRYINYRDQGVNYYGGAQLRIDKQEGINLLLSVKYTWFQATFNGKDTYSNGTVHWTIDQAMPTLDIGLSLIYGFTHKKRWIF